MQSSLDGKLPWLLIVDRQIKFTYLANITKKFVEKLNEQMNSFHEKQFIVSNIDSIHEEKARISSINQLKISILCKG